MWSIRCWPYPSKECTICGCWEWKGSRSQVSAELRHCQVDQVLKIGDLTSQEVCWDVGDKDWPVTFTHLC